MTKRKNKILLLALIADIFGMIPLFAEDNEVSWNWKPSWSDKGDCGPNALYVLMNLCGKNVSIQEVKKRLPFDPVIGHHLEWIALLPESFDVPKETIRKAIVTVTEQIEQLPPIAKRSFKTVLPCSHAAKALTSLIHQESFDVRQRLNQSEYDSDSPRKAEGEI